MLTAMDMKNYLKNHTKAEREALAARCGTSVEYFWQIAGGHRKPSHGLAIRLEEASGGAVTREGLRPDIYATRPRKTASA